MAGVGPGARAGQVPGVPHQHLPEGLHHAVDVRRAGLPAAGETSSSRPFSKSDVKIKVPIFFLSFCLRHHLPSGVQLKALSLGATVVAGSSEQSHRTDLPTTHGRVRRRPHAGGGRAGHDPTGGAGGDGARPRLHQAGRPHAEPRDQGGWKGSICLQQLLNVVRKFMMINTCIIYCLS